MCTVSFVRAGDSVIITSNRDEHIQRENAAAPAFNILPGKKIIFPKDARAGGTWFAAADNGTVSVLLNGAFKKHIAAPPYRKSRGLILLEMIEADNPVLVFSRLNLDNIEPFTVVLYQPETLHELRWDGTDKFEKQLDIDGNYIWSSSTLYSDDIIKQRENLFHQFIQSSAGITAASIQKFHNNNHGDIENGFVINRATGMKTFSITQAVVTADAINFLHTDLLQQKQYTETMSLHQPAIKFK
jgi:uncharacterized protein with NRDE domain